MALVNNIFEKSIEDIKIRIKDFNQDFSSTLLDGIVIETMSGQFLDHESDYFYSNDGLKEVFNVLKQKRINESNLEKPYNYLLIKQGVFADSDLFDEKNSNIIIDIIKKVKKQSNIPEDAHDDNTLELEKNTLLFTISSNNVRGENSHELFIYCIFTIQKDMPVDNEYFTYKMERFLKYPSDFFNSPIINKYFEAIKYKRDIGSYAHTVYNTLPNSLIIIEGMVKFISENHPNSDAYRKIYKAYKGLKLADLSMRILAGKEIKEIQGKNIKGIMDIIVNYSILADGLTCTFDYENYNEHLDSQREGVEEEIFTILFNLWSNASKCKAFVKYKTTEMTFHLKIWHGENGILRISFRNPCNTPKPQAEVRKMLSKDKTTENQSKGLYYIKDNISRLGWSFDPNSEVREEEVEIIILTK